MVWPTEAHVGATSGVDERAASSGLDGGRIGPHEAAARSMPAVERDQMKQPRSLRLRLALWYGALLALALLLFAGLILLLASDALYGSVETAVTSESRGALAQVRNELTSTPPH